MKRMLISNGYFRALIYLFLIRAIFCPSAFAQHINAGMNMRFMSGHMNEKIPLFIPTGTHAVNYSFDQAAGFEGGAYAEVKFGRHFAIQPEMNGRFTTTIIERNDKAGSIEWTNGSFAIPLLFKYRIGGLGFLAGPEANITLFSTGTGNGTLFSNVQFPENSKEEFNTLAWSAVFGVEYTTRRPGVGLHLRYALGLTPVWKTTPFPFAGTVYEQRETKMSSVQFGLHCRFGKDKSKNKKTV